MRYYAFIRYRNLAESFLGGWKYCYSRPTNCLEMQKESYIDENFKPLMTDVVFQTTFFRGAGILVPFAWTPVHSGQNDAVSGL